MGSMHQEGLGAKQKRSMQHNCWCTMHEEEEKERIDMLKKL
jgi:hypothetical protein